MCRNETRLRNRHKRSKRRIHAGPPSRDERSDLDRTATGYQGVQWSRLGEIPGHMFTELRTPDERAAADACDPATLDPAVK